METPEEEFCRMFPNQATRESVGFRYTIRVTTYSDEDEIKYQYIKYVNADCEYDVDYEMEMTVGCKDKWEIINKELL